MCNSNPSKSSAQFCGGKHVIPAFIKSPRNPHTMKNVTSRSRATSDALEKLLSIQAQQLTAIGEAWRAKFSLNRLTTCHESNLNEPYDTQINGLSKSQRSLRLASTRSHGSSVSKNEKEKSWNDGTRCSVDSLSNHASMFEETNDVQLDVKEEEEDRLETRHQDFTLLTEAVLHEFLHSTHHSIIDHKTLVLDWLNHSNFNDSDNFNGFQTDEL
ncbi:uncharacterized protein MELLADRAFT_115993 [Melampsora larici-populina 98AG31]|uniref:Uncharacterized protein n=1 Tax=Melampsora larici-populina (strain 98AG31 / pathotype 3-4-7) TaxID=747676 RepID=F4RG25_MELLP|nr:uncharacterized protein MELLADRAFT_115993 [Melampsora larici-populina 98AG31]EGG08617.1 hypothetical protein MELLADRAFT_115993 [Melampsora larici-populina 98AG31]